MPDLDELLAEWSRTVTEVERGYNFTYDDYLNDVDVRHRLRLIAENDDAWSDLHELDSRFLEATVPSGECIWGDENAHLEGWQAERHWYYWRLHKAPGLAIEVD